MLGPTGSGKSDLALAIAAACRGEIVNYDSVQVYRGLDIGSAKLAASKRQGIPHHLLDILELDRDLTAGAFARLARSVLQEITTRGGVPVLVGGTGFYLRSLLDGLSPAPKRDEALRRRLTELAARRPAALHRFLRLRDPVAAARIHHNDHQKLTRAVEIMFLGGQPTSVIQSAPRQAMPGYSVLRLGLAPPRSELYSRINSRCSRMFEEGLIEETSAILGCGLLPDAKPLRTLGYRQAVAVLTGSITLEEAVRDCQTKTRQYAKRQITWFRRERDVHWLTGFGTDTGTQSLAIEIVRRFLR